MATLAKHNCFSPKGSPRALGILERCNKFQEILVEKCVSMTRSKQITRVRLEKKGVKKGFPLYGDCWISYNQPAQPCWENTLLRGWEQQPTVTGLHKVRNIKPGYTPNYSLRGLLGYSSADPIRSLPSARETTYGCEWLL